MNESKKQGPRHVGEFLPGIIEQIGSKHTEQRNLERFLPIHRMRFGVKKVLLETYIDKKCSNAAECSQGLKWIYNGIQNARGLPNAFLDVLNTSEILAFYVGVWKLKYDRDNENGNGHRYSVGLEGADHGHFPDLVSNCIKTGEQQLSIHWDFHHIYKNVDVYELQNPLLETRLSVLSIADTNLVREMLSSKLVLPMHKENGSWMGDFKQPLKLYRKRNGNGGWNWKGGGWDNKRAYAQEIYDHFVSKESKSLKETPSEKFGEAG